MKRRSLFLRLGDLLYNTRTGIGNLLRRRRKLEWLVIALDGPLPEISLPQPWWQRFFPLLGIPFQQQPLSLDIFRDALERIAGDPRPKGIILQLDEFIGGWTAAYSVRTALQTFKKSGKKVVAHISSDIDTQTYYLACAADEIYAAPGVNWVVLGLRMETIFLKDALEIWGITADVIAVSPYKTGADTFSKSEMSPEFQEQFEKLLDGYFDELVRAISEDRGIDIEKVKEFIDTAPITVEEAVEAGLLNGTFFQDELPNHFSQKQDKEGKQIPAALAPLESGYRTLAQPRRRRTGRFVGIVSVEGVIVPGESRNVPIPVPFLGSNQAGANTVVRRIRAAETNPKIAAVVLYVDSRGGASGASTQIWREVHRLARQKPVVVYMGSAAASGGYLVSAPGNWIVAQPLTLTGSIGVYMLKPAVGETFRLLRANPVSLQRGANAGVYSALDPLTEDQRAVLEKQVYGEYEKFKDKVVGGRKIEMDALELIAGGRVWQGFQAMEVGLVDEIGGMDAAIRKAIELAKLPGDLDTPVIWVQDPKFPPAPNPFPLNVEDTTKMYTRLIKERMWMLTPWNGGIE